MHLVQLVARHLRQRTVELTRRKILDMEMPQECSKCRQPPSIP